MLEHPDPDLADGDLDDPEVALRDGRHRFVLEFPRKTAALHRLAHLAVHWPDRAPIGQLHHAVHRLIGFAGLVGFTHVSEAARDLERIVGDRTRLSTLTDAHVDTLAAAFERDLSLPPPAWAAPDAARPAVRGKVVLAVDDRALRGPLVHALRGARFRVRAGLEMEGVDLAREDQPDLLVLQATSPRLAETGLTVKTDPSLAGTNVAAICADRTADDVSWPVGPDLFVEEGTDPDEIAAALEQVMAAAARQAMLIGGVLLDRSTFLGSLKEAMIAQPVVVAFAPASPTLTQPAQAEAFTGPLLGSPFSAHHLVFAVPGGAPDELAAWLERRRAATALAFPFGLSSSAPGTTTTAALLDRAAAAYLASYQRCLST